MEKTKSEDITLLNDAKNIYPGLVYVSMTIKPIILRALYFTSKVDNHYYIYCFDLGLYSHAPSLEEAKILLFQIIQLASKKENSGKQFLPGNPIYEKTFLELISKNKLLAKSKRITAFPKNAKLKSSKDLVAMICA
ncbi:MAG: hypothetical protein O9310_09260 [Leptospiraceae bacterium]|jgi:hypothetical protein|nr:hypothetical protein [Leptospiraceae bacterium]